MSPRGPVALFVGLAVAVVALAIAADRDAVAIAAVPALARAELAELDRIAGLRAPTGASAVTEPLPVAVAIDGPPWLGAAVTAAVADDEVYAVRDGPHRIVGELVVTPLVVALRLSLERRGWLLHATPVRRRLAPALAVVPALVGLGVWAWSRRAALGAALAGGVAQIVLFVWPWPAELSAPRWIDDVAAGPVGERVVGLARAMDDTAVAVAAGVVALTVILALFDHRRSRSRGAGMLASGVVALVGALVWIEAAGRASVGAWLGTAFGIVALVLAAVLVGLVLLHHRRPPLRSPA